MPSQEAVDRAVAWGRSPEGRAARERQKRFLAKLVYREWKAGRAPVSVLFTFGGGLEGAERAEADAAVAAWMAGLDVVREGA